MLFSKCGTDTANPLLLHTAETAEMICGLITGALGTREIS